ncbi:hypothetical protein STSP2_03164 [Anaerohalosphaera lusitana]|uniref:Uncharacterized protein n=1 Tax=Anaerohalosphaera lusitana TaxID=1936003 RepID=A0A1U9NQF1_9BACT|nr:hypothetical protein [Anaerohalosphaera lusitana]AQT69964.1 hypothetical protein STSP2_03164 [Anaerohalosphaera lusitana]
MIELLPITVFDTVGDTSDWTKGAGWSETAGGEFKAVGDDSTVGSGVAYITMPIIAGRTYALTFTVSSVSVGADVTLDIGLGGGTPVSVVPELNEGPSPKEYTCSVTAGAGNSYLSMELLSSSGPLESTEYVQLSALSLQVADMTGETPSEPDAVYVGAKGDASVPDGDGGTAPAPCGVYVWDSDTDHGGEQLGYYNGERVYISQDTHPDGAGGDPVKWYIYFKSSSSLYIIGTVVTEAGQPTGGWYTDALIADVYIPSTQLTGTLQVSRYNQLAKSTRQVGIKTDGVSGYAVCAQAGSWLNQHKDGKFAVGISTKGLSVSANYERYVSSETAESVGIQVFETNDGDANFYWFSDGNVSNAKFQFDRPYNSDYWHGFCDGAIAYPSNIALAGPLEDMAAGIYIGSTPALTKESRVRAASIHLLDLDACTITEAWRNDVAAILERYKTQPHTAAAKLVEYDSNIEGIYYAFNETASPAGTYMHAYDIQTQTALETGGYVTMVSEDGVRAVSLGADPFGRGRYNLSLPLPPVRGRYDA